MIPRNKGFCGILYFLNFWNKPVATNSGGVFRPGTEGLGFYHARGLPFPRREGKKTSMLRPSEQSRGHR